MLFYWESGSEAYWPPQDNLYWPSLKLLLHKHVFWHSTCFNVLFNPTLREGRVVFLSVICAEVSTLEAATTHFTAE